MLSHIYSRWPTHYVAVLCNFHRSRLHFILQAMMEAQVVSPKSLDCILVHKELEYLAPSSINNMNGSGDTSWLKGYIEVISPWPTPTKPMKAFDLLQPGLCDVDVAPSVLLARMDKSLVGHIVLAAILDDPFTDASAATLKAIVEECHGHFRSVDLVTVGMEEAEQLSDLIDAMQGLFGLLGTWADATKYKSEVLDLADNMGKDGSKASVVIANGVKTTTMFLAKLAAIVVVATTLEIAMPLADNITSELRGCFGHHFR